MGKGDKQKEKERRTNKNMLVKKMKCPFRDTMKLITIYIHSNLLDTRHLPSLDEGCWDRGAGVQFPKCLRPNLSPGQYSHLHLHV